MTKKIIGIDWASNFHVCYDLEEKKSFKIGDDHKSFQKLLDDHPDYVFVIEEANNRIGEYITNVGRELFVLPPYRSKKAREYHEGSGGKNDKIDAKIIALTFNEHPEYCIKITYDDFTVLLGRLITSYDALCITHQQLCNRLNATLKKYFPEFLKEIKKYKNKSSLFLLSKYPTPGHLKRATNKEIRENAKLNGIRIKSSMIKRINKLREAPSVWIKTPYESEMIAFLSKALLNIRIQKDKIISDIKRNINKSKYKIITTMPGIGPVTGAYILRAYLSHHFTNYRQLQSYCGTSPVIDQSGKRSFCKMRRRCDHDIRDKLHNAANAATICCSWAKKYYARKKKEGKRRGHALRALANTMLKIVFSMLKNLKAYDELLFLSRRGKNPSYENYTPESYQFQSSDYSQYPQNISSVVIEFGGLT